MIQCFINSQDNVLLLRHELMILAATLLSVVVLILQLGVIQLQLHLYVMIV